MHQIIQFSIYYTAVQGKEALSYTVAYLDAGLLYNMYNDNDDTQHMRGGISTVMGGAQNLYGFVRF